MVQSVRPMSDRAEDCTTIAKAAYTINLQSSPSTCNLRMSHPSRAIFERARSDEDAGVVGTHDSDVRRGLPHQLESVRLGRKTRKSPSGFSQNGTNAPRKLPFCATISRVPHEHKFHLGQGLLLHNAVQQHVAHKTDSAICLRHTLTSTSWLQTRRSNRSWCLDQLFKKRIHLGGNRLNCVTGSRSA